MRVTFRGAFCRRWILDNDGYRNRPNSYRRSGTLDLNTKSRANPPPQMVYRHVSASERSTRRPWFKSLVGLFIPACACERVLRTAEPFKRVGLTIACTGPVARPDQRLARNPSAPNGAPITASHNRVRCIILSNPSVRSWGPPSMTCCCGKPNERSWQCSFTLRAGNQLRSPPPRLPTEITFCGLSLFVDILDPWSYTGTWMAIYRKRHWVHARRDRTAA